MKKKRIVREDFLERHGECRRRLQELANKDVLLVHNTFTKKEDFTNNYYCTCPKANLYIEDMLPDFTIFNPEKLCVGTDSLASNDSLSILEELQVIQDNSRSRGNAPVVNPNWFPQSRK